MCLRNISRLIIVTEKLRIFFGSTNGVFIYYLDQPDLWHFEGHNCRVTFAIGVAIKSTV